MARGLAFKTGSASRAMEHSKIVQSPIANAEFRRLRRLCAGRRSRVRLDGEWRSIPIEFGLGGDVDVVLTGGDEVGALGAYCVA